MKYILTGLIFCIAAISCNNDDDAAPAGGKGGIAVLKITPRHHSAEIDSCTVYIKYNSSNVSATYDDSAVCVQEAGLPVATFSGLKTGNYYLYGKGWDPAIAENVKGGLPYTINTQTTLILSLPVSENH